MTSPATHLEEEKLVHDEHDESAIATDSLVLTESKSREAASRLTDDLELLRAEKYVSNNEQQQRSRPRPRRVSRSHNTPRPHVEEDVFNQDSDVSTKKKDVPTTTLSRMWQKIKTFPRIIRYFLYMVVPGVILLTPVLLGKYAFDPGKAPIGGDGGLLLLWFGIWLEIVWLSLWAARIITAVMPYLFHFVANSVGSNNSKKWKDIGRQLELHTALFLWMMGVLISFHPITDNHRAPSGDWSNGPPYVQWIDIVYKVTISLFVLATLNFVEKMLIQWIATSFHMRTYASRIEVHKVQVSFLVQLFEYSKHKLAREDSIWQAAGATGFGASDDMTPLRALQVNAQQVLSKVGNAANRVVHDFAGRKVSQNHPKKVVVELLRSSTSSHTLARIIYRSLIRPNRSTLTGDDFKLAFASSPSPAEDAESAFGVFDKDMNGDVSMEELETVCNEIQLERKAIAASLKDLDSVIRKLDKVLLVVIFVVAALVFVAIISNSAAAALTSAGTTLLGLAWMLQATAQEFLQSIIFVFVKHPFDVGDRVTVYGNTGSAMKGDDYYVTEVSLLYTEFKKLQGHIVQAPNSLLNTLFILNQRRSGALSDPIELKMRFGTPPDLIEELRGRMEDFVRANKRDYQPHVVTEVRTIDEVWSVTVNFVFFHKSNFQNELLRLNRHNRFAAELMLQMATLGIESPRKMQPGGSRDFPLYWTGIPPVTLADQQQQQQQYLNNHAATAAAVAAAGTTGGSISGGSIGGGIGGGGTSPAPHQFPRRANSTISAMVEAGPDFQEVYESRRQEQAVSRLASIRQGERLNQTAAHASGSGVGPTSSADGAQAETGGGGSGGGGGGRPRLFHRLKKEPSISGTSGIV